MKVKPFRVVIVDDEPLARENLSLLLQEDDEIEIVRECEDGDEAIKAIAQWQPDLVFLDVQMPGKTGFDVLSALPEPVLPEIIFVTAYDDYAIQAFAAHALDYLTKPFRDERFHASLARAKQQIRLKKAGTMNQDLLRLMEALKHHHQGEHYQDSRKTYRQRIMIKEQGRVQMINTADIDWIEADDYYVQIHHGKACHLLRENLNHLETTLDPAHFFRAHRSVIVNMNRIKCLQKTISGGYEMVLHTGSILKLSRGRRKNLENMLGQNL